MHARGIHCEYVQLKYSEAYVFSVGGMWCHAQKHNLSGSGMQSNFIVLSAVMALAVSLSRRQNGKSCDGSEEERARSLA